MSTNGSLSDSEAWHRLALYRERYDIEDKLGIVSRLDESIRRRRACLEAAGRRVAELERQLAESRHQLAGIEREIEESARIWPPLIDEIIDQVRVDFGEAWTPRPVRGFRMWRIGPQGLFGASGVRWTSPTMVATCLRGFPGEDLPHSVARCGPPACGIYATKRIRDLGPDQAGWLGVDQAVGVVALTGKVVEHEEGYRGARATVVAIGVRWATRWVMTSDASLIESLFVDPLTTVRTEGSKEAPSDAGIETFLNEAKKEEETWI